MKGDGKDGDENDPRILEKDGSGDICLSDSVEKHEANHGHPANGKGYHEDEVLFGESDQFLLEEGQNGEQDEKGEGGSDLNQHGRRDPMVKEVLRCHAICSPHCCGQGNEEIAFPLVC